MASILTLLLSLLFTTIHCSIVLTPAPTLGLNPAVSLSLLQPQNTDLTATSNNSNLGSLLPSARNLSALQVQCDSAKHGDNLNYDSCYDAYQQISHLINQISFGPRWQGQWDVHLPFRVYSCKYKEKHFHCTDYILPSLKRQLRSFQAIQLTSNFKQMDCAPSTSSHVLVRQFLTRRLGMTLLKQRIQSYDSV